MDQSSPPRIAAALDHALAFDRRGEAKDVHPRAHASTTAKVHCMFCRTVILPTAGKVTAQDVATHSGCWGRAR
jgi:hypothetical protein